MPTANRRTGRLSWFVPLAFMSTCGGLAACSDADPAVPVVSDDTAGDTGATPDTAATTQSDVATRGDAVDADDTSTTGLDVLADTTPPPTDTAGPDTTPPPGDTTPPPVDTTEPPPMGPFWRLETPADSQRTWLVSPAGERVFGLGVNTVMRGKQCDGMPAWIRRADPTTTARVEWARLSDGHSGGHDNAAPYCFNSVGAFSETNDFDDAGGDSWMIRPVAEGGAGAPYSIVVYPSPKGTDRALKDEDGNVLESGVAGARIGDPFNPAYHADLDAAIASKLATRIADPRLQMIYPGNEIGLFDRGGKGEGVRDFRRWIWSDCPAGSTIEAPLCAPHALAATLRARYGTVGALNAAWDSAYPGEDFLTLFDQGPRPVPYEHDCNLACREDLQRFVHHGLKARWVYEVTTRIRAVDPNHLVATPRLALGTSSSFRFFTPASEPDPEVWFESPTHAVGTDRDDVIYNPFGLFARSGDAGFDVVAVNVYTGSSAFERPWFTHGIHDMQNRSGLPVVISEFGVRAHIDGWTDRGGAGSFVPHDDATDDQIQRGARYRDQIDQFIAFRGIVGANWHAWSDRYLASDPAHQINMGLIQCDDPARGFSAGARWDEIDDRIAATNCDIMTRIEAATGL